MDFVNVAIRIKPCPNHNGKSVELLSNYPPVIVVPERQLSFSFDNIFAESSTQEGVYDEMVKPLVRNVMEGYNSTIFAYGQTGTGKTFTIGSDPSYNHNNEAGLITRALNDIMSWQGDQIITTYISFVEIYNEKVYDLLSNSKTALQIKGFNVSGVRKQQVLTLLDAHLLLVEGGKNRHTGETKQNHKSSRSHAIFTIYCNVKFCDQETEAKLNLVDLAGSESVKKTGNEGSQLHEGININKGLLCIGQVINALSNNHGHIPYRQSTITTILQDSLNKKNFVTLIACIGTKLEDLTETVQTLDFAQRAKRVKNKPEVNNIIGEYTKSYNVQNNSRNTPYKLAMSTPYKRIPLNPHSHNIYRKRKPVTFNSTSNLSAAELSLKSTSSLSIAAGVPDTLSPIVNRCIEAVGETLLKRVTAIVSDIMTPMTNRVNSPRISRRSLEREVTKIVRGNLSLAPEFQTFRNEIVNNRNTSVGGIDDNDAPKEEDQVSYGFLADTVNAGGSSPVVSGNKTPSFKKPFTPVRHKTKRIVAASSPIHQSASPAPRRRSVRISLRKATTREDSFVYDWTTPNKKREVRRSTRLSSIKLTVPKTIISPVKTRTPKKRKFEAKAKIRNKEVLDILNHGTIKEIMKLSTIGVKNASMICQFRELKGRFRKISDLTEMPWRGNGYALFTKANFLEPGIP